MGDNIIAENPEKEMLRLCARCPHMNQITLEDTLKALEKMQYVVDVPEDIRLKAKRSRGVLFRRSGSAGPVHIWLSHHENP